MCGSADQPAAACRCHHRCDNTATDRQNGLERAWRWARSGPALLGPVWCDSGPLIPKLSLNLGRLIRDAKPMVRVRYDLKPVAGPDLAALVKAAVA